MMKWKTEGAWAYLVSINRGESHPTFLVLGKSAGDDRMRPILCSGHVKIVPKRITRAGPVPKLEAVIKEGVLPTMIELRILDDARAGDVSGSKAAISRWCCLLGIDPQARVARSS
jgi:hypothetical protein